MATMGQDTQSTLGRGSAAVHKRRCARGYLRAGMAVCLAVFAGTETSALDHPCFSGNGIGTPIEPASASPVTEFTSPEGIAFVPVDLERQAQAGDDLAADAAFLAYPAGPANRWNQVPAWITVSKSSGSPRLLQEELLSKGLALLAPREATPACLERLLAAEAAARRKRRGVWSDDMPLSTRVPDRFRKLQAQYVVAEGRIVSLGKTDTTRYLNFGWYWKEDLTAVIPATHEAAFNEFLASKGLTLALLAGHAVRIRGYVDWKDGPLFRLTHPGQLQVLDGKEQSK